MELHLYRHLWGLDPPWTKALEAFQAFGYRGVEVALPHVEPVEQHAEYFRERGLLCLPMIFTTGKGVSEHVESFRTQAHEAARFNPPLITCHDGRDAFTRDEASRYYREVLAIEANLGVPVAHETHRGRILYNPWVTASLLDEFEGIRLCCDFSHWVCVCERLIDDQIEIITQCADRALHIHARVGYNEGPQVPDPSDPLFAEELAAHERWWMLVWESQHRRGFETTTMTPEFGPPPYMQTEPFTGNPVADQQLVSDWQAQRQRQRFEEWIRGTTPRER
jgi:sugar phosphate isomerase/epimerase